LLTSSEEKTRASSSRCGPTRRGAPRRRPYRPCFRRSTLPARVNPVLNPRLVLDLRALGHSEPRPHDALPRQPQDISDEDILPGFVLTPRGELACPAVRRFEAQLRVVELLEHKSIFSAGYAAILHVHAAAEECTIVKLISSIDKKTGARESLARPPRVTRCRASRSRAICPRPCRPLLARSRRPLRRARLSRQALQAETHVCKVGRGGHVRH